MDTDMASEGEIFIETDISLDLAPNAPPVTGSIATEVAIKTANMIRTMFMNPTQRAAISDGLQSQSSDVFASFVSLVKHAICSMN